MTITVYTEGYFNAAHALNGYAGPCAAIHGHTWKIAVWVKGEESQINSTGILWDFNGLFALIGELDHTHLNEAFQGNPTAEKLALYCYGRLKKEAPGLSFRIRIYESTVPIESYCETGDF